MNATLPEALPEQDFSKKLTWRRRVSAPAALGEFAQPLRPEENRGRDLRLRAEHLASTREAQ